MSNHVGEAGDVIEAEPLGDKKSHLLSYMVGFCTGAFVCSMIVLGTAIAQNTGS